MSSITDRDLPPPYQEKPNTGLDQEDDYFVRINNGSLSTVDATSHYPTKQKLIHDEQPKKCEPSKIEDLDSGGEFQFIKPVAVRSLAKFFQLPKDIPSCDSVSSNFTYNLWYFQINYALLLVLTVFLAMQEINCWQFNLEICLAVVVMAMVFLLNKFGCQARALGRKIKLSEQLTTIFLVMTVCNGLLPEAFDFIFFFGAYVVFVFIHASVIQVRKSYFVMAAVHDI